MFNHCREGLVLATRRHDDVLVVLPRLLTRKGHAVTINKAVLGQQLRPHVDLLHAGARLMVDVAVSYDTPHSLEVAFRRKVEKYEALGITLALVVGFLGSWYPWTTKFVPS